MKPQNYEKKEENTHLALYGESGTCVFASIDVSYSFALQREKSESVFESKKKKKQFGLSVKNTADESVKREGKKFKLRLFIWPVSHSITWPKIIRHRL